MFPCAMEKTAFPTRDALIHKRNLFLLSGRAVSHCRQKSLQEKQVPTDQKKINLQILINGKNKLSNAKLYKSNLGVHLSLYILKLSIFFCQLFVISLFSLNFIFLLQVSSITFTYCFSVGIKPIQNIVIIKEKNLWLEILLHHLKKYCFLIFVDQIQSLQKMVLKCKILISNLTESVIMTNRQKLVILF